jgi:hypothetical protein
MTVSLTRRKIGQFSLGYRPRKTAYHRRYSPGSTAPRFKASAIVVSPDSVLFHAVSRLRLRPLGN